MMEGASTKDFIAALPSAVKNQALRDARSVWKRSFELGSIPVLRKPICQWNNQNWRIEGDERQLLLPVCQDGQVGQTAIRCAPLAPSRQEGHAGPAAHQAQARQVDRRYRLHAAGARANHRAGHHGGGPGREDSRCRHVISKGTRFLATGAPSGRAPPVLRPRKQLQQAKKVRAVRKSQGKEQRWMRDINHKLSRHIVSHAQQQGVGIIRLEQLAGIRQRTARTSRGAKARKNNRMIATWPFHQLATFIAYKAERAGIAVEWVDPAYTSQTCPACFHRNKAQTAAMSAPSAAGPDTGTP